MIFRQTKRRYSSSKNKLKEEKTPKKKINKSELKAKLTTTTAADIPTPTKRQKKNRKKN